MKKKLLSLLVVLALVIGLMPMTAFADDGDQPVIADDQNFIKITVNTGGKGNVTLDEWYQTYYPGLMEIHENEPNVVYVDKSLLMLNESERGLRMWSIRYMINPPNPQNYHNGPADESHCYFLEDPSKITDYDTFYEKLYSYEDYRLSELAENDKLTLYTAWFAYIDKISVEVVPATCGQEINYETVAGINVPSGEKWQVQEEYKPFWGVWESYDGSDEISEPGYNYDFGYYEAFEGTAKGGDDMDAVVGICPKYGYCFAKGFNKNNITVKYKDWQGKTLTGQVNHMISFSEYSYESDNYEIGAGVKAQHVPGPVEKSEFVKPTCTKNGSHREVIKCSKCNQVISDKKVTDKATGHNWGPWKVIKKATFKKDGKKKRVCKNDPSHVQTKTIPALGKGQTLLVTMKSSGSNKLVVSWKKVKHIDGVDIYLSHCNRKEKKAKPKLYKSIKGNKITKYTIKGLKANTAYKAYAKAWVKENGKKKYVLKSPRAHVFTSGSTDDYTNPKSVKANKSKVSVKAKKSCKVKLRVVKLNGSKILIPKRHTARIRWASTDKKVAKANKSGKIKGVKKGTCYIYFFATNGVYKKIKVKVK